mmetsp:Transcript_113188/g.196293  ORF Transcript_113188/g.196293 Transcript_113188/m.196293 type:complete len:220 (+) Transcript_113188:504-1163(+)
MRCCHTSAATILITEGTSHASQSFRIGLALRQLFNDCTSNSLCTHEAVCSVIVRVTPPHGRQHRVEAKRDEAISRKRLLYAKNDVLSSMVLHFVVTVRHGHKRGGASCAARHDWTFQVKKMSQARVAHTCCCAIMSSNEIFCVALHCIPGQVQIEPVRTDIARKDPNVSVYCCVPSKPLIVKALVANFHLQALTRNHDDCFLFCVSEEFTIKGSELFLS